MMFQFSIGDAHVKKTVSAGLSDEFQFSIGDADFATAAKKAAEVVSVSILYWRCAHIRRPKAAVGGTPQVSILYWRCQLIDKPASRQASRCREFQFSIGDATRTASRRDRNSKAFQFSIGDAYSFADEIAPGMCRVSILYWRCANKRLCASLCRVACFNSLLEMRDW